MSLLPLNTTASKSALLNITQDLIRFRTSTQHPEEMERCMRYISHFFAETSWQVEQITHNGVHSLFISRGTKTPRILLVGHVDVVEADDLQFIPRVEQDRLYGRGSFDMKGAVAVMMQLMKDLTDERVDIGLLLTSDEELGGFNGVGHLLKQGFGADAVILPDGGRAVDRLVIKAKGILWVKLLAHGTSAHGSRPWEGDNAIIKLINGIEQIQTVFTPHTKHAEDHWETTMNVGMIEGGKAVNQVPDTASVRCDIRYTEHDTPDDIVKRLRIVLPSGVDLEVIVHEPMVLVPLDHPFIKKYEDVVHAQYGAPPRYALDHGSSDARFFAAKGIPVIMSQPNGDGLHGPEEWVSIPALQHYYNLLRAYVQKLRDAEGV